MKAVITVLGRDRTGIIANVSNLLYTSNVNILDISQTILSEMFTMIMLVELSEDAHYDDVRLKLSRLAEEMQLEIRMQRSDIFDAMHRI